MSNPSGNTRWRIVEYIRSSVTWRYMLFSFSGLHRLSLWPRSLPSPRYVLRGMSWQEKRLLCLISAPFQNPSYRMLRYVQRLHHCTDSTERPRVDPLLTYFREGPVGGDKDCFAGQGGFNRIQDTWTAVIANMSMYKPLLYSHIPMHLLFLQTEVTELDQEKICFAG